MLRLQSHVLNVHVCECVKYNTSQSHQPLVMVSRPTGQIPGFLVQLWRLLGLSSLNKMTETIKV